MRTSRWIHLVWVLVALCYLLPFGPLRHVQAWYGSFLAWAVIGVLVIIINALVTRRFLTGWESKDE
ncbi:hypothetical protein [Kushneria phosphatilytica]|uniref:Uncharacterized protein n=1 Tax=Kushneria phosphatilytica TaxID=657387 RepID=A0A1S1NSS8_9GAMM|nr:hypothetical protein [Kushneria phosphatilytica]OHV08655.1 hypothetical protein BH688_11470 [Kushneria phosphatilytica]QEL12366.1 hypothetical protein FY550_15295 [Kushneria phosphatilytica]